MKQIKKKQHIQRVSEVESVTVENFDLFKEVVPGIGVEFQDELRDLLISHQHSFAFRTSNLGHTDLVPNRTSTVPSDYKSQLLQRIHEAYVLAQQNLYQARAQQKEQYDKRVNEQLYEVGDKVLLSMKTPILGSRPYRVTNVNSNKTVEIRESPGKQTQLVHINRLKPLCESMIWGDLPGIPFVDVMNELPITVPLVSSPLPIIPEEPLPPATDEDLMNFDDPVIPPQPPTPPCPPTLVAPPSSPVDPSTPPPDTRPPRRTGLRPWNLLKQVNPKLFVVLVFVLAISCPLNAFNATVCDCSEATNVGFLRFPDEECSFQPTEELPQPVEEYALFSTIPEVKRFAGHICSMWEATTTVYKDFMQWNTVTNSRKPIPVDDAVCRLMRDTRICRGRPMEVAGNNIFSLGDYPYVEATWLRTATETFMNCRLEEVTLQSECANCTISSPLGDIQGSAKGSFHHNLVTLVREDTWKETLTCQERLVEAGEGRLYKGDNSTTLRVRDPSKQLNFIYTSATIDVCSTIGNRSAYHAVLGMGQVAITVRILPNKTASTDYIRFIGRDR
uniref:Integrase p58-like C-terminal domain-containing protein n=1 Tax=Daphnia galeata TaxID=27404 RepID=A0A8J2RCL8_9CRUS|nr:unnamed protein product [Daphnia galeata]